MATTTSAATPIAGILASQFGADAIAVLEMLFSAYTTGSGSATLQPVSFSLVGKTFSVGGTLNATAS